MIQVDLPMPKYCMQCYFLHEGEDQRGKDIIYDKPCCRLTGREEVNGNSIWVAERPDDCPLEEVPDIITNENIDNWRYIKTEETIIGMNEITGELDKFKVFNCSKCGYEVTEWQLEHSEYNYCPRCGNRNGYNKIT